MQSKYLNKSKFLAVWLIVLIAPAAFGQTSTSVVPQPQHPIHILVIGDSILWGQGLKTERKTWYLVKLWLEKNTGRKVIERIEAHSGAVIERASATDNLTSDNREVNLALPMLHDQLDNALKEYADPAQVDLVLLSGCGNDVGLLNLLNAVEEKVDEMTSSNVASLLRICYSGS